LRSQFLPYCLPQIGEEEIAEVVDSLRSGWVTTGPKVNRFERAFAEYAGVAEAVAVNSCTAALHLSLAAGGIGPGDEVIVPTMTFCATANVVVHLGARPVLADVDDDGLINVQRIERLVTERTKAIIPVHYAGQSCDLDAIRSLARGHGLFVVEDCAHAAGARHDGRQIGTAGNPAAFSFYATKNMTTGEGGMVTTDDPEFAARVRRLALHGMSRDAWKRYSETGTWYYEVLEPGYKCNMTDIQASLGIHQLKRLDGFVSRRRSIAKWYNDAFSDLDEIELPRELPGRHHVFHLYPIRIREQALRMDRAAFIAEMTRRKIGASVHFIPLHRHPYYQATYECRPEAFEGAEKYYRGLLSLPLYPRMSDEDAADVVQTVREIVTERRNNVLTGSFRASRAAATQEASFR
jgi:dTDP-4-amino-4,6-dideoxygalactose transaminase